MKIPIAIKTANYNLLFIACILITMSGCFGEKYEIKSPKIKDPSDVSTACAQNLGLDEQDTEGLTRALKKNDGKLDDEFKLRAMAIISESDSVDTADSNSLLKSYFSCLENSANKDS